MMQSQFWNEARFAALDLTLGHEPSPVVCDMLVSGGMTTADFAYLRNRGGRGRRWIGADYYITSEQLVWGMAGSASPRIVSASRRSRPSTTTGTVSR